MYDPATGRFNRLDPFAGNLSDPQSLHKYAYVHGDPVNGVDPTGLAESLVSSMIAIGMGATLGYIVGESIAGPEVKEPSFGESLVPVYGASQEAIYNFQQGNYFLGTFHTGLAISDWLLIRAMYGFALPC